MIRKNIKSGVTLVELMIAAVILIGAFTGILLTYIKCMELSELSKNSSIALAAAKNRLENIKNTPVFTNINTNYHQISFIPSGLNGRGISYVDASNPQMYKVTISVSWRQSNGRVIGEDRDLDGVLDAGEDVNANGQLDSPVQIVTNIFDVD